MKAGTVLDRYTRHSAELARPHRSGKLRCVACAHRCLLADGRRGACRVRFREGESLRVPWGYTAGVALDPIEKKPFFHVIPGAAAFSFGMLGCDMRCPFCQNWLTSQTLRDPRATARIQPVTEDGLVRTALEAGAAAVVSTYNEPLITAEWARSIFKRARPEGLLTGFVSNGHATPDVLEYLRPVMDMMKIDLKTMRPRGYRSLGGHLDAVLDTIRRAHSAGFWVEVVTLVVPGFNDDPAELRDAARFLVSVSPDIPWHVTAFHPDYRVTDRGATPPETLVRAWETGRREGLRFVYAGNLPGLIEGGEDTRCSACGALLVSRHGFRVLSNRVRPDGTCPDCGLPVPGLWKHPGAMGGGGEM